MILVSICRVVLLGSLSFLVGGLPLTGWIVRELTGKRLAQLGTGNVSVSAAFYHGGKAVGILAALSEAGKGIGVVLLARWLFPGVVGWELVAIIVLVLGRNLLGGGAGTTNAFWGYIAHDWLMALVMVVGSGVSFGLIRHRKRSQFLILALLPCVTALRYPDDRFRMTAIVVLCLLLAGIFQRVPDDMELPVTKGHQQSNRMLRWLQPDRKLLPLTQVLDPQKVGQKAATLSQLLRWGYAVPMGWVLPIHGDPQLAIDQLNPTPEQPLVVRSSAVGEDSGEASAAGQYQSVLHVTNQDELRDAIATVLASYDTESARQYRRDRNQGDSAIAVLIQHQIQGTYSGVAFSRDPISCQGQTVLVEALPGDATQVVSGTQTPEQYRLELPDNPDSSPTSPSAQAAHLARQLEQRYHGIPQDIEWTHDGQNLWLLQARPITTLLPLWTRKIAAEVIPGTIRPLTWSVNQPLTCGVWGEIFTIVLGSRAIDLDFGQTATLHYGHAYFNASLLGEIFLRMGLPPNSLEFLTRGAKFSRPPILSTLKNVPGLLRLVGRERSLIRDWQQDDTQHFVPALAQLNEQHPEQLAPPQLLARIESLLSLLERATYYSIMAPLSLAARQAIMKVDPEHLKQDALPEVASVQDIRELAAAARPLLTNSIANREDLWRQLSATAAGQDILEKFNHLIERYGYLSEVGTDIAVETWRENPRSVEELLTQFCLHPPKQPATSGSQPRKTRKMRQVQKRLDLKGRVTTVYSQFLAHLRWSFMALAQQWQAANILVIPDDIFFLELDEIRQYVQQPASVDTNELRATIHKRQQRWQAAKAMEPVPFLIYGNHPPADFLVSSPADTPTTNSWQGIGVSVGQVEGPVKVMRSLQQEWSDLSPNTILVVPYTDSGWAPLLARAAGLIADVGGRLSHGAIVAREYGIPAVMDIHQATQQLQDGQRVRIDGQRGIVERLS